MIGIALKIAKSKTARKAAKAAAKKIREEVTIDEVDVSSRRVRVTAFGRSFELDADDIPSRRPAEVEAATQPNGWVDDLPL